MFPTAEAAAEGRRGRVIGAEEGNVAAGDDVPYLDVDEDEYFAAYGGDGRRQRRRRRRRTVDDDDDDERYLGASPRRDAVTTFMSTRRGATKVRVGGVVFGAAMGGFVGKVRNIYMCMYMAT
jgi:hypothetical protein